MPLYQNDIIVEGSQETGQTISTTTTVQMSSGIYQLLNTTTSQVIFTGSTSGQIVKLPDATTLRVGWSFSLWNTGSVSFAVQNNGGSAIVTANTNELINVSVTDISTSNGVWNYRKASIKSATELTKTDIGLENVTNDAQLKRADGDINTFTEKTVPTGTDLIIIEDSAASYAKKKVQMVNIPSSGAGGNPAGTKGDVQFRAANNAFAAAANGYFNWDDNLKALRVGPAGVQLSNCPVNVTGNVNSYVQTNNQNLSNGTSASGDFVVTTDDGNDQAKYIDLGINSSGYNDGTFTITGARDGYLYVDGGNLAIGVSTANDVKFFTGGTLAANEKVRIVNATGNLLVGTTTDNTLDKIQIARGTSVNFPIRENFDDFLWSSFTTNPYSVVAVTGDGGTCSIETDATGNDYAGLVTAETGVTNNATGYAVIDFFNSANKIRLGGKRIHFATRIRIQSTSSSPVAYQLSVGLQDANTSSLPANGVFFAYTHSVNSGKWVGTCSRASTSTSVNSSISLSANTWYKLVAEINAAGNSVTFYIDDTLIGTITTNIPASTTGMRFMIKIAKTSLTTTSRYVHCDFLYWKMFR